jgi:hypothetical protein
MTVVSARKLEENVARAAAVRAAKEEAKAATEATRQTPTASFDVLARKGLIRKVGPLRFRLTRIGRRFV